MPAKNVETFLAELEHPHKPEIIALREVILGADSRIAEGIKWNAPSFHTSEHFATMHLRDRAGVRVIMHLGAKAREPVALAIDDPDRLLEWLAPDRASALFRSQAEVEARREAFSAIIRQWISFL